MSDTDVSALLAGYPALIRDLTLAVRALIRQIHPTVVEVVRPGWKIIALGVGERTDEMACGIVPAKDRVRLSFAHGATLADPDALLAGVGRGARQVQVRTMADVKRPALRTLIKAQFDRSARDAGALLPKAAVKKRAGRPRSVPKDWVPAIADDAVVAATSKHWRDWIRALDALNAAAMVHADIVKALADMGVKPWWRQMLAVGYEQARGLREKHQTPSGYQTSVSKTVNVPVETLYRAWDHAPTRARWLRDLPMTVTTRRPAKSMRGQGPRGVRYEVIFVPKGHGKSAVQVEQTQLESLSDVAKAKAFWTPRLAALKTLLEK